MRRVFAGLTATAFVVWLDASGFAKTETITGRVVDQSCYLKYEAHTSGVDHKMLADEKECAISCAKEGRPMAILTDAGKLYTIGGALAADHNARLVPHIRHRVDVTGDVTTNKDGSMTIRATDLKVVKNSGH